MNAITSAAQTAVNKTIIFYHAVNTHPYTIIAKGKIQGAVNVTNQWIDYSIKVIPTIPAKMHSNVGIAIGVIVSTNILFFVIVNKLTNFLHQQFSQFKPDNGLSRQQKWFKNRFCFDGIVLGGSVALFNRFAIPYIFNYNLSNWITLATAITAVFARQFLRTRDTSKKMNAHQLQITQLNQQLQAANNAKDNAIIEKNNFQQQVNNANQARDYAINEKNNFQQQVNNANQAKDNALNEKNDLQQELNNANQAKDNALNEKNDLQQQLNNANQAKDNALNEKNDLQQQLNNANQAKNSALNEKNDLQQQLNNANQAKDNALNEKNELQQQLNNANQAKDNALNEKNDLQQQLNNANQAKDNALNEKNELQQQLNNAANPVNDNVIDDEK